MIKSDIISFTLDKIKEKRTVAQLIAKQNFEKALVNKEFNDLYKKINGLNIDIALSQVKNETEKAQLLTNEQQKLKEELFVLVEKLGYKKQDFLPKYSCEICQDTGFKEGKFCECFKREISSQLLKQSNIDLSSASFEKSNLSIFDEKIRQNMQKIYDIMQDFCEKFPESKVKTFVFSGGTGTGKTYLTQCVALNLIEKGNYVYYTTAFNLSNQLLNYHIAKVQEKGDILDNFLNCDLLIIDDLGVEPIRNNVTLEYLYTIISERKLNNKFTIISTNLSPDDILNRYGERIFSRLLDKSSGVVINFSGEDLRLKRK